MKQLLGIILFLPVLCFAGDISSIYWSPYACEGYIYHFDPEGGTYRIYTRIDMKDLKKGAYTSYQLAEGKIQNIGGVTYALTSQDVVGQNTIEFIGLQKAVFISAQQGRSVLIPCNEKSALALISDAEKHFETCQKNVLNCKSGP